MTLPTEPGSLPKLRAVLVDRDGVLNENVETYVRTVGELKVFPGVGKALALLRRAGFRVFVITNQAGIGKGLISTATLDAIHARLERELSREGGKIGGFYVCPHKPDEGCECRKPKPGLLLRAQREWGFDLAETYFVGDAVRDVEAARAAGCRPVLVKTGILRADEALPAGVVVFENLPACAAALVRGPVPPASAPGR